MLITNGVGEGHGVVLGGSVSLGHGVYIGIGGNVGQLTVTFWYGGLDRFWQVKLTSWNILKIFMLFYTLFKKN